VWMSWSELSVPIVMRVPPRVPLVSSEIAAQYPVPPNAFCLLPALMRPQSRGYLRIKTAAHGGLLEIQPNFLKEQADVDALVAGVDLGLDIGSQPAFRDLIKGWVAPTGRMSRAETVAFVRRACFTYHHPVGTCAMGTGPDAVVDAELRVRGIEGLRIADASVMPTIPSANTNAPTVMIGEFASRRLLAECSATESAENEVFTAAGTTAGH